MNLISLLAVVSACCALFLAGIAWKLYPRSPLNRWMILWCLTYGVFSLGEAFVLVATTSADFWWAYKVSRGAEAILQPLSIILPLVFVGARGGVLWVLTAPLVVAVGLEFWGLLRESYLVTGFRPGPWGNVLIPTDDFLWLAMTTLTGGYTAVMNLIILAWGWMTHKSAEYRSFIQKYFILTTVSVLAVWFFLGVLWLGHGFPLMDFLFGLIFILGVFYLVSRYQFLHNPGLEVDPALLQTLQSPLLVLDSSGRITHLSSGMMALLDRPKESLLGRSLIEVLGPWQGLSEALSNLGRPSAGRLRLEGTLGSVRCFLTLIPSVDRFNQIRAVYARLDAQDTFEALTKVFGISQREKEVGLLAIEGLSTDQIGESLFISPATVKNHLHNLFRKTATKNRVELVRLLLRSNL